MFEKISCRWLGSWSCLIHVNVIASYRTAKIIKIFIPKPNRMFNSHHNKRSKFRLINLQTLLSSSSNRCRPESNSLPWVPNLLLEATYYIRLLSGICENTLVRISILAPCLLNVNVTSAISTSLCAWENTSLKDSKNSAPKSLFKIRWLRH